MDKKCSGCDKVVYPIEQLKCLDQVWHKGCFKCQVCSMTLNMKNYKGFDKKPYCGAHYPQPKSYTFVSDNPEMQRVKQNTAVISNVQYHSDFEKAKGRYTAVTDDPESLRHRQNAQVVSNVKYHEDFEKARGAKASEAANLGVGGDGWEQQQQPAGGGGFNPHSIGGVSYTSAAEKRSQQQPQQPPQYQHYQQQRQQHPAQYQNQQPQYQSQQPQYQSQQPQYQRQPQYQPQPPQYQQPAQQQHKPAAAPDLGRCYRALYAYAANDTDEVSFNEGDLITNGDPIDEGWMYGRVERTGQFGMLPANYVAAV